MPEKDANDIFKENLKQLLSENNMTSREFAEKIGVKASTVSMWLTGKNSPRMDLLDKIADLFNIPVSILLTGRTNVAERGKAVLADLHTKSTIAAHFDGSEYTEEELEEIRQFAEFVKSKRKPDIQLIRRTSATPKKQLVHGVEYDPEENTEE